MHVGHFIGVMAISACFITAGSIAVKAMPVERVVYDTVKPNPDAKIIDLKGACQGRYTVTIKDVSGHDMGEGKYYTIATVTPLGSSVVVTCRIADWVPDVWDANDQVVILNGTAV